MWKRLEKALEWPVAVSALLIIPALILEERTSSPDLQRLALSINWIVWLVFCLEFLVGWLAAPSWVTVRKSWFNLVLILISPPFFVPEYLQATRSLRIVRSLRLLRVIRLGVLAAIALRVFRRLFSHRKFHFVAVVGIAIIGLGALGMFLVEGDSNPAVKTFGDAMWWSVVTASTVGYGDVSPTTAEGRLIAVVLMVTGIGVIGVFTATVASFFFDQDQTASVDELSARLDVIERKLDQLLAREDTK